MHPALSRAPRAAAPVKPVRLCFLLLLALLLPIRGAVAAAMLCPVGSGGMHGELRVQQPPMDHGHAAAGHAHDGSHHAAGSDKCTLCAAFCSLTPLMSSVPTLPEPLDLAAVQSSDHGAPPPLFFSDGQDRPPRTA